MPLLGQGQRPWRKGRGGHGTAKRNQDKPGRAEPILQTPLALKSHIKSGAVPEASLSTSFTGHIKLSKTPQEDDCSSLPTPKLLQS